MYSLSVNLSRQILAGSRPMDCSTAAVRARLPESTPQGDVKGNARAVNLVIVGRPFRSIWQNLPDNFIISVREISLSWHEFH
jgi:hypothetical protein